MPVSSTRNISVAFTGDVYANNTLSAATNTASPGGIAPTALSAGNNTIAVPAGATGVTIEKPDGNTVAITFKGVAGDTGYLLGLQDPDSFSVGGTSFVLSAAAPVTVWLHWS